MIRNSKDSDFLVHSLRLCRYNFITVAIFSFCINLLMLSIPLYLLQLYDRVIPNRSVESLWVLTTVVVIAMLAMSALEAVRSLSLGRIGVWLDQQLSPHVLSGSLARRLRKHALSGSERDVRDVAKLRQFITGNYLIPLLDIPWTPVFIGVLFLLHPLIGFVTLFGAAALFIVAIINERATRSSIQSANDAGNESADLATSIVANAEAVEAMGMRNDVLRRWSKTNNRALQLYRVSRVRREWLASAARLLRAIMQIVLLAVAGWLILEHDLTAGALIASMLLMRRAMAPIDKMIGVWKAVVDVRRSITRIKARLAEAPSLRRNTAVEIGRGGLIVSKVAFGYSRAAGHVLRNIDFSAEPGQVVVLKGSTAAGKSTLARLLVGIAKPAAGRIRLRGVDIAHHDRQAIGGLVGYVPQNVILFPGSIRENIARMSEADLEQVTDAARLAHVYDLIMRLPEGFDTQVGEHGEKLSGGQRQRIALAQAVFGQPSLVVLDEPDANLDRYGKRALVKTIAALQKRGTIVVIVTHSSTLLELADVKVHLNNGRQVTSHDGDRSRPTRSSTDKEQEHDAR